MKYVLILIVACLVVSILLAIRSNRTPAWLGVHAGSLASCPDSKNCVSSQTGSKAHYIEPINVGNLTDDVMARLRCSISGMDGAKIVASTDNYLCAEFTSSFWRFKDDLECFHDEENGGIQIRSASRVGYSDFGVNRKRLETLRELLTSQ